MRVLLINGSPRHNGNTAIALNEVARTLDAEGIETITIEIGNQPVRGCIGCAACVAKSRCVFSDPLYDRLLAILQEGIDGLIVGSPVYYGSANGSLCALLDRLFYSASSLMQHRPAASVVVCRRGGASSAFDRLNKYFTINNMPVVPSQYWNSVHGAAPGEAAQDLEGLQTMRTLARNMAWMLRGMKTEERPQAEPRQRTNFIR
jgi:multimeric flavodoxin WrbA